MAATGSRHGWASGQAGGGWGVPSRKSDGDSAQRFNPDVTMGLGMDGLLVDGGAEGFSIDIVSLIAFFALASYKSYNFFEVVCAFPQQRRCPMLAGLVGWHRLLLPLVVSRFTTLGILPYPATSMNAHVAGFSQEDAVPRGHRIDNAGSNSQMLIDAAYRQLFFHTMAADREPFLESQFRNGQITMQQFMRGLCLSERFQRWVYQCNSNYDVAAQLVQRLLGREVNGEQEKIAWSIILCQDGLAGLVDVLLNSPEYMDAFGVDTVPYQRRRILSGRPMGNTPFNISLPRYGTYWRDVVVTKWSPGGRVSAAWANGVPAVAQKLGLALSVVGSFELVRVFLTVVVAIGSTAGH